MKLFKLCCVWAILILLPGMQSLQAATINGSVKDPDGKGLVGANVVLTPLAGSRTFGAATDLDGRYIIMNLPVGDYSLTASMVGYTAPAARELRITDRHSEFAIQLVLQASSIALEEIVVRSKAPQGSAEASLDERMNSAVIIEAVGGEELARMPDADVSGAVRRSAGVAITEGDPVIRGMGVRYSKVTLNNAAVSGTEPNRSSVSLELFPASLMRQLTVSKAYSADQGGEFGGGRVNMNTWDLGDKSRFTFSMGTGGQSGVTFGSARGYDGGGLDFLGFDDGTRGLPDAVENATTRIVERGQFSSIGYTAEELEVISESFENNWEAKSGTANPDVNLNVSSGTTFSAFGREIDLLATGLYKYKERFQATERSVYKGGYDGAIELQHHYDFRSYKQEAVLGGLMALTWDDGPWSRYRANLFYNRDASNETRSFEGYNGDRQAGIRDTRLRFVANSVTSAQVSGHHVLPGLHHSDIDWMVSGSHGTRYEPDTREYQYEAGADGVYCLADEAQSGSRIYNDLVDNSLNAGVDLTLRFDEDSDLSVKTGLSSLVRRRDAESRFFQFEIRDNSGIDLTQDPDDIFIADNIDSEGFLVREATRPTDSYEADQDLLAGYLMSDFGWGPRLRCNLGVRYEWSRQKVVSYELFTATATPVSSEITEGDILPALNLTYQLNRDTNLRLALSQTVSRPDFREMSEFEYTDIIGGHAVIGNPNLERALIRHADLRAERRFAAGDLLSASVFVKQFVKPIETVIQPTSQNRVSYENADEAYNYGLELEWRQHLANLPGLLPVFERLLTPFSLNTNLSLLESEIALSDSTKNIQTSSERPLAGQSPYLFNLNLAYVNAEWGTQVDVFYHTFGKRISEVGRQATPRCLRNACTPA